MSYCLEEVKDDLITNDPYKFYMKYIVRSENWYFENVLGIPDDKIIAINDDFKQIITTNLGVSFNSVMMVGSGKVGCSLAPHKIFNSFHDESDLDIAIISSDLFHEFWKLFRYSFKPQWYYHYGRIFEGIYRGYINDKNIERIQPCRKEWKAISLKATSSLKSKLFIRNEINYRLYRSWEDFEEYNLQSIYKCKRMVMN